MRRGMNPDKALKRMSSKQEKEEENQESISGSEKTIDNNNNEQYSTFLNSFIAWIHELPKYIQNQLLNSIPIKTLIESLEQTAAILDIKSIAQDFAIKTTSTETAADSTDITEDELLDKIHIYDARPIEAIDMTTMILKEPTVTGWILPQVVIALSGSFTSNQNFNGLADFYGHGIDLF